MANAFNVFRPRKKEKGSLSLTQLHFFPLEIKPFFSLSLSLFSRRQHPAVVTAPFIAPGRFVGESCVAAADFGTVRRNILHVFDKGATPDMDQLAAQVSGAVVGISGAPLAPAAPELPSYGVPIPAPVGAGSSASSAAAVGAGAAPGGGAAPVGGAGGIGGGLGGGGAAPEGAAAAGSSGSRGRK